MEIKKKKALVLTYHVKNCVRRGGFHEFIEYLKDMSFDIDWVTCTMSSSWIIKKNDRENARNFFELWKGTEFIVGNGYIRHFAVPVMLPAKIAKYVNRKLYNHYWPKWKKIRRRLADGYDVILVEGVACQYAIDLKRSYPNAQIIYRPSDILESFSSALNPKELERQMIDLADVTYCVDGNQLKYYSVLAGDRSKIKILRNPITQQADLGFIKKYVPEMSERKSVVFLGITNVDIDVIEYAAARNIEADFMIIGPFDKESHDNVYYLGSLKPEQYRKYLEQASVGINPMLEKMEKITLIGYTRKIVSYMKYLMPVVATCSDNYLGVDGYLIAKDKEEFSAFVKKALSYSVEERMKLKEGYEKVITTFLDTNVKEQLRKAIEEKVY